MDMEAYERDVANDYLHPVTDEEMIEFMNEACDLVKTPRSPVVIFDDIKQLLAEYPKAESMIHLTSSQYYWIRYCQLNDHTDPLFNGYSKIFHKAPWGAYEVTDNKTTLYALVRNPKYHMFENKRSHCLTGYAIEWLSGHGQYWVQGVFFTDEEFDIYFRNKPTVQQIMLVRNAEKRTVIIMENKDVMITDPSSTLIDDDQEYSQVMNETIDRKLYDVNVDGDHLKVIHLTCHSTLKPSVHMVEPTITTCSEAVKWMNYGYEGFVYQT